MLSLGFRNPTGRCNNQSRLPRSRRRPCILCSRIDSCPYMSMLRSWRMRRSMSHRYDCKWCIRIRSCFPLPLTGTATPSSHSCIGRRTRPRSLNLSRSQASHRTALHHIRHNNLGGCMRTLAVGPRWHAAPSPSSPRLSRALHADSRRPNATARPSRQPRLVAAFPTRAASVPNH